MVIRIIRPDVGDEEAEAIGRVLASGFLTQGAEVARFEKTLAATSGSPHAVAVSSGTAALHLALLALGIGPGDEVVTSAFTFPATVNVIELVGARPVLVDIDRRTYNLNPSKLEETLTRRTRLILPVHEFGLMADMESIGRLAERAGLPVVEDAACALGARQRIGDGMVAAGAAGAVGCFSFHPRKSVTTGEGGCVVTGDASVASRLQALRNHGLEMGSEGIDLARPGLNYRMSEIQAAIGTVQVGKLPRALAERRRLAALYGELLADCEEILLPGEPPGWEHVFQSYVVWLGESVNRELVIKALRRDGIEAVRGAYAVHRLRYYRERYGYGSASYPAADAAHDRTLAVPLYPGLSEGAVADIARLLKVACNENRK